MSNQLNKSAFSRRSVLKYMASTAAACPTCMSVASALASGKKEAGHGAAKAAKSPGHNSAHWSYGGDTGPGHWGEMNAGNKVCIAVCF